MTQVRTPGQQPQRQSNTISINIRAPAQTATVPTTVAATQGCQPRQQHSANNGAWRCTSSYPKSRDGSGSFACSPSPCKRVRSCRLRLSPCAHIAWIFMATISATGLVNDAYASVCGVPRATRAHVTHASRQTCKSAVASPALCESHCAEFRLTHTPECKANSVRCPHMAVSALTSNAHVICQLQ